LCRGDSLMTAKIAMPEEPIADSCRRWQIVEQALFGSVMRDDFIQDGDVELWNIYDCL